MNKDKYTDGNTLTYATSIASTWAWAPALFISGNQAYNNGLLGFSMFFIPNALTLFLFGLFAYYMRTHYDDTQRVTVENMLSQSGRQKKIHLAMTLIILFCSCCMQLMGIFMVTENFFQNKIFSAIIIFAIALYTTRNGIKSCIQTDLAKYFIILGAGIILLTQLKDTTFSLSAHNNIEPLTLLKNFGIPTALGLLAAPYIDSTFVQRMYCIKKENLIKTFGLASILFAIIPLMYGAFGFLGIKAINTYFVGANGIILLIAVLAALMSTLDSNLCALEAIIGEYIPNYRRYGITLFYCLAALVIINPIFDMTKLFTLYCTIRCTTFIPTLLIGFDRYDKDRLFYVSLFTCIVACIGYLITQNFMFTLLGLFLPIFGYKKKTYNDNNI